jgi:glycosyltransferase involved in cell wall biosynthesis
VFTHPSRINRGAGESRNLGIEKSTYEYIAFLDADDWYLANRFVRAREIFEHDASVDGVYDATGYFYEESQSFGEDLLTAINRKAHPNDLLFTLLQSHSGRFHTNAITLKRSILEQSGLFDGSLELHQDTHLWLRLAFVGKLVPGQLTEPVAIRRVHDENRIHHASDNSRRLLHARTFEWFRGREGVDPRAYRILFNRYAASRTSGLLNRAKYSCLYFLERPGDLRKLF